jgi:hypothetical protein
MNDAELQAARDLVAAARPLRDQMREDWGYHQEPEEVLDEAVGELLAERDRLRATIEEQDYALALATRRDAERKRLRAVVDAAREYRALNGRFWSPNLDDDKAVEAAEQEAQAWQVVVIALDELDRPGRAREAHARSNEPDG